MTMDSLHHHHNNNYHLNNVIPYDVSLLYTRSLSDVKLIDLPDEILITIFSQLKLDALDNLRLVCWRFYNLISNLPISFNKYTTTGILGPSLNKISLNKIIDKYPKIRELDTFCLDQIDKIKHTKKCSLMEKLIIYKMHNIHIELFLNMFPNIKHLSLENPENLLNWSLLPSSIESLDYLGSLKFFKILVSIIGLNLKKAKLNIPCFKWTELESVIISYLYHLETLTLKSYNIRLSYDLICPLATMELERVPITLVEAFLKLFGDKIRHVKFIGLPFESNDNPLAMDNLNYINIMAQYLKSLNTLSFHIRQITYMKPLYSLHTIEVICISFCNKSHSSQIKSLINQVKSIKCLKLEYFQFLTLGFLKEFIKFCNNGSKSLENVIFDGFKGLSNYRIQRELINKCSRFTFFYQRDHRILNIKFN